jgi:sugar/nucleoside kinase (ribokinase family)
MPDVCCIGNVVVDAIARNIDRFPEPGRLVLFDSLTLAGGGNGLNAACDLARLGTAVALIGKVGADALGDFLLSQAMAAGVDVAALRRDRQRNTSFTFVAVNARGERSFTHTLGAGAGFGYADVDMSLVRAGKALLVSSFVLPAFDGPDAVRVLREARAAGRLTAWDAVANEGVDMWGLIREGLPHMDYCIPSEIEARLMLRDSTGPPAVLAERLQRAGARNVVIKLAEAGCLLLEAGGRRTHLPAYHVDPVVDTTGAGDAWAAGFLSALLAGDDPRDAAMFGNAVAAHCIMAVGASTGIKPAGQIREWAGGAKLRREVSS